MSTDRYEEAERVFKLLLEAPASEHAAILDRECGNDAELRAEVESLQAYAAETGTFLDAPAMGDGFRMSDALPPEDAWESPSGEGLAVLPERIGKYRVHDLLGEGGFGLVYRAREEGALKREVALKIIKPGMDSRAVIARFEAERQALAMMEHPNVAKVYDGGSTEQGRPYFAMEFVPGLPITAHCDRHQLSLRERLELFTEVCDAVQHAHQKGVIHRDLKPSNILVRYADGKATPKVIDFGIAKALGQSLTEATIFTQRGELIGTPAYMSPEQADFSEQDIDTRSDIYALGVVLYELLTGALPFDSDTLRKAGLQQIQNIICNEIPPKPSLRLQTIASKDKSTELSRTHKTSVQALTKSVKGDLDWVVMKCLEKDRGRRYGSASELAAEIGRYLNTEPVLAGPPSVSYRVSKFVQKHKVGVGAAAIGATVIFGLLVGLAVLSLELSRSLDAEKTAVASEREQRQAAEEARSAADAALAEAERRREQGETALVFVEELFQTADPGTLRDEEATARDLAKTLAASVEADPPADAYAEFRVRRAISFLLFSIGEYKTSVSEGEAALAAMERVKPGDIEEITRKKAVFDHNMIVLQVNPDFAIRSQAAARCYELAEEITAIAKPDDPTAWNALNECAAVGNAFGDREKGLEFARRALARQQAVDESGTDLGYTYLNLMLLSQGEDSIDYGTLAFDILRDGLGEDHPHVLIAQRDLGLQLIAHAGKLSPPDDGEMRSRGVNLARGALQTSRRVYGVTHPTTGDFAHFLATALSTDEPETEALFREALTAYSSREAIRCETHRSLNAFELLADCLIARGKNEEGIEVFLDGAARIEPCLSRGPAYRGIKEKFLRRAAQEAYQLAMADPSWSGRALQMLSTCAEYQLKVIPPAPGINNRLRNSVLGQLVEILESAGRSDEAAEWKRRYDEPLEPAADG